MASLARKFLAREAVVGDRADDDPVLAAFLHAPVDERPETEEERAAIEAAKASARASGRMIAHDEVVASVERLRPVE
jgi:hypothetical protein